ncbi:hypothetical protein SLNSH_02640 [Alsobacter soli]|uniref:MotA/TolQ/ExbB proton channel domain-containing protein n=1 Tax=Alsobacter soli TaxID=2109933 RepID=A0A2T1HYE1_9HYPH|nr:MotA/TolQ/ExbB proton channel family protein [Alsobacter soli]PSC06712.1 hypothetical protein SLNSH_02640 [Alsobacter soli]
MTRTIWIQALRIALVFAALAALATWQHHFILAGLKSNPYLNALIIGVFAFGSLLAMGNLAGLRNDVRAFSALKSVYDDVQAERLNPDHDRRRQLARCLEPGIVYRSPELFGHVFDLTLEELLRTRHMRISVATMQHLISAIESRMAHRRSLMGYLTGLCVFLGLIGTFIGLMEMVGSVGGIIGGLAQGDSASAESMKRLIHDLEAPLTGMATGFSCSLFGLFSSLMLGLFSRFVNSAGDSVKNEFEAWLAGISQIETRQVESQSQGELAAAGSPAAAGLGLAVSPDLAASMRRLAERQDAQAELLDRVCRLLDRAAHNDSAALHALSRTEALHEEVARLREDVARQSQAMQQTALSGFDQIARLAREQQESSLRELSEVAASQAQARATLRQIQAELGARATEPLAAGAIAQAVTAGVGDLASALDGSLRHVAGELARLSDEQRATTAALAQGAPDHLATELRGVGRSLQNGLQEGFAEMAQSFEHAFQAYAGLVQHIAQREAEQPSQRAPAPARRPA